MSHPVLREMEAEAHQNGIPIIDRTALNFIRVLLRVKGEVQRILEIGTAIGYSAAGLALASPQAHIDTIERDERWVRRAVEYFKRAGLSQRITVHHADALTYCHQLKGMYDVIFIDATKRDYRRLFEQYAALLNPDGIIITDNVLFKGRVAGHPAESRRLMVTAEILNQFNRWLITCRNLKPVWSPSGTV